MKEGSGWTGAEPAALAALIRRGAREMGLVLPVEAAMLVARYGSLLVRVGRKAGFRAPADVRTLVAKHLLDSASCLMAVEFPARAVVADVGSGVGLPGLVLAACLPENKVVLIEPRTRRAGFCRWAAWRMGLENVEVVCERVEELVRRGRQWGVVVSRALARWEDAAAHCLPLVGEGGVWLAMLGPRGRDQVAEGRERVGELGGGPARVVGVELPWRMGTRVLVVVEKASRSDK